MKLQCHTATDWDVSLWSAVLTPLIRFLLGFLGRIPSLITESRHKDENKKPETNERGKATEMVSVSRPVAFA